MRDQYCCDIIIPMHHATEGLKNCISSILRNGSDIGYRIIIINDNSLDEDAESYFNELISNDEIIILKNDGNLGFAKTVNLGMRYSENDVILLDCDTIVTQNWIRKLYQCAYSQPNIATVTPLTNNSDLYSVPDFCQDDAIFDGYSIDSFARFVERISPKQYPNIPSGSRYCMFIKREAIDEIGFFDEESFEKSGGDEIDFCYKCSEGGYTNVVADDTFLYHSDSMSFCEMKRPFAAKDLKVIEGRYPYHQQKISSFIARNPLKNLNDTINSLLDHYKSNAKNVLYILHNDFEKPLNHPIGGTEFHVKDLTDTTRKDIHFFALLSTKETLILKRKVNGIWEEYIFPLSFPIELSTFTHKEYKEILEKIIYTFNINIIHIHHLMRHTFDSVYIAKKYHIPCFFTMHDCYFICPKVTLLDEDNVYCIDIRNKDKCQHCLKDMFGYHSHFLERWKREIKNALPVFYKIIAPSNHVKAMIKAEYDIDGVAVIEHGLGNKSEIEDWGNTQSDEATLNVAFIGGLSVTKGSHIIYDLLVSNKDERIKWFLIGEIGDQRLNLLDKKGVVKVGKYNRDNITKILKQNHIQLVCILSICPETFSYTLSEAWAAGIPVLGSMYGAVKERIMSTGAGLVLDELCAKDILTKISAFKNDEALRNKLNAAVKKVNLKTVEQMDAEYYQLYDKAFAEMTPRITGISALRYNELSEKKVKDMAEASVPYSQYKQIEDDLNNIYGSLMWRLLMYVRRRFPWSIRIAKKIILFFIKLFQYT